MRTQSSAGTIGDVDDAEPVFWSQWDSGGGPGFNGATEVFHENGGYICLVTNYALEPPSTRFGPFLTLDDALNSEETCALFIGPGTIEVGSTVIRTRDLLKRLKVDLMDEFEDEVWELTVNGKRVRASRSGLVLCRSNRRRKKATKPRTRSR